MTRSPDCNNNIDLTLPMPVEALTAAFIALREDFAALAEENKQLKARIAWFEKQLFGQKSEKRVIENPYQNDFLTPPTTTPAESETKITVSYERGTAKKVRPDNCTTDAGLRFSDEVPVEIIRITPPELVGESANDYEIIDTKISRKLAQQPANYVVLQYDKFIGNEFEQP
jgi:transposase